MMTMGSGEPKRKVRKGSKLESAGRGYIWIENLIHRGRVHTCGTREHRAWQKEYYGRQERERRAKYLARAGRGKIVMR